MFLLPPLFCAKSELKSEKKLWHKIRAQIISAPALFSRTLIGNFGSRIIREIPLFSHLYFINSLF
ncbi:hypothetical protein GIB67_039980 [Kingdonia uniflora]|uniref:Uncharacterized protein n=1 Tax=Kingdonia uniflora TaxID=39325 RepID=A0A7J7P3K0_9MAGN|nr:hypothetical protein GIB67_039980 [Kingdonia uniflora]